MAEQWLALWEHGHACSPCRRALALLAALEPEVDPDIMARWPLGYRDLQLLRARQIAFGGDVVHAVERCPQCGQSLELEFSISELLNGTGDAQPAPRRVCDENWQLTIRPAASSDLLALEDVPPAKRRAALLARCVTDVDNGGAAATLADAPASLIARLADELCEADPLAEIKVETRCDQCGTACLSRLDIMSFLWTELCTWAERLLGEIHVLASGYGWSEREILALGPWRRQVYLNMVRQ